MPVKSIGNAFLKALRELFGEAFHAASHAASHAAFPVTLRHGNRKAALLPGWLTALAFALCAASGPLSAGSTLAAATPASPGANGGADSKADLQAEPGIGAAAETTGFVADEKFAEQRAVFVRARRALQRQRSGEFTELRAKLEGYPLTAWLDYEHLRGEWDRSVPGEGALDQLNEFEARTADRLLSERLARALQERLIATRQYSLFLTLKQSKLASAMPCSTLRSRYATGRIKAFDEESVALWVQSEPLSSLCRYVLRRLEQRGAPPVTAIWERIFTAIENDVPEAAESVLHYLGSRDRRWVADWLQARTNPSRMLRSGALADDTVLNRRMLADLVEVWSRTDPTAAVEFWQRESPKYVFFADRYYDTWRALAMRSAYRRMPEAGDWLHAFTARDDDLELMEWRVRVSLLAQDWEAVLKNIAQLPVAEQEQDHWAYWVARSLEQTGRAEAARPIYTKLTELQSYHGFLAADRLDVPYALREEAVEVDASLLDELANDPQLIRAREYQAVGLSHHGRSEWRDNVDERPAPELAASAVLAARWGLYDRAIYSAGKADVRRALSLRFPALHRGKVMTAAAENRIDPAWVFGVMRRESAYISDVRSYAGAIGLMQLMPTTATYVAGLKGQGNWRGDLTDVGTNIDFGTFYLRHVLDEFDDHQTLATASYNAGPHRVAQWLMPVSMDADIWVDTIPFTETRRYVRAVLAYTSIYEWRLSGEARRLVDMMPTVPADAGI